MSTPDKPATFAKLLAEWDARLAAEGFETIEARHHRLLNVHNPTPEEAEAHAARAAYLDRARDYWRKNRRLKGRPRRIWKLHAEGLPYREIAKRERCSLGLVNHWVERIRRQMERSKPRDGADRGRSGWQVKARFTDSEAAVIQRWADEAGLTPAELARRLILAGGTTRFSGVPDPAVSRRVDTPLRHVETGARELNAPPFVERDGKGGR